MFLKANEALTNPHHLRDLVRPALLLLLGVEFVVNFFPLPLWAEILLVPVLTTVALFGVVPQGTKGVAGAKQFSEIVLGGFFVFLVVCFLVRVATDFSSFASSETLARFWVPPALTLVVLPFFYVLGLTWPTSRRSCGFASSWRASDSSRIRSGRSSAASA